MQCPSTSCTFQESSVILSSDAQTIYTLISYGSPTFVIFAGLKNISDFHQSEASKRNRKTTFMGKIAVYFFVGTLLFLNFTKALLTQVQSIKLIYYWLTDCF